MAEPILNLDDAGCFACIPEHQLLTASVRILMDALLLSNPMADVTVQSLLDRSGCINCLPDHTLLVLAVRLSMDILSVSEINAGLSYDGRDALRAVVDHEERQQAYLNYLVVPGDDNGGEYIYRAAVTTADDGSDYLKPDNVAAGDPGRWVRSINIT